MGSIRCKRSYLGLPVSALLVHTATAATASAAVERSHADASPNPIVAGDPRAVQIGALPDAVGHGQGSAAGSAYDRPTSSLPGAREPLWLWPSARRPSSTFGNNAGLPYLIQLPQRLSLLELPPPLLLAQAQPPAQPAPAQPAPAQPAPAPAPAQPAPAQQPAPPPPSPPAAEPPPPPPAELLPEPPPSDPPPAPLDESLPLPPEASLPPPPPPAEGQPASEPYFDPNDLEVVTVTVDRRERRVQDYPGSVSAFSQQELERINVNSVRDLGSVTPAVEVGHLEGNTEIYIRGVGTNDNTELGDPAAATHIDGVYIPRPRGIGAQFFDLERVEINRGPQGTLRGRNATAGTLNLITNKPQLREFDAEASLQYGNYSQVLTRGMINVPIGDDLALRLATYSENRDSFFENAGPIFRRTPPENANTLAYRAGAKWVPVKELTVLVGHDWTEERGSGYLGSNFAPALTAGLQPDEVPNPRRTIGNSGPQSSANFNHWGVHGDVTADFGDVLAQYLGSYRDMIYRQVAGGGTQVNFPGAVAPPGEINVADFDNWDSSYWRTTSQSQVHELRFYSPDSARLRWTVGGFLFDETQEVFLGQTADQSNTFAGVEFNHPDVSVESQAAYADATFDITKVFRATAGIRFTHESKAREGLGAVWLINGVNQDGSNFRFGTEGFQFAANNRTIYPSGPVSDAEANAVFLNGIQSFGLRDDLDDRLGDPAAQVLAGTITPQSGEYSANFFDWRAGVDYDLTDDSLLYFIFSTGHKSGGFNDNAVVTFPDGRTENLAPTYDPESVNAFEIGSKNEFRDLGLTLNGAAFAYLYTDQVFQIVQQVASQVDPEQTAPATTVRFNAAKSRILGLEIDAGLDLPAGLLAQVSTLFLDARFSDGELFDNRVAFGPTSTLSDTVDISGNNLPRAPHFTINYSLSQNIETGVGWFDWTLRAQTRTKHYQTVFNGEGVDTLGNAAPILNDVVPTYTRFDVAAGYTRPDGNLRLDGFVSNLTNTTYLTTLINTPGLNLRFFNPPRQVGVRLSVYY